MRCPGDLHPGVRRTARPWTASRTVVRRPAGESGEPAASGRARPSDAAPAEGASTAYRRVSSAASARGVGKSNSSVEGSASPVHAASSLRRSTAARESSPRSASRASSTISSASSRWPRTRAARVRTLASSIPRISPGEAAAGDRPSRFPPPLPVSSPSAASAAGVRSRFAAVSPARRAAGARRAATTTGSSPATAASKRARPSSGPSGPNPERAIRCRSASPRCAIMPSLCCQGPQTIDVPGSPSRPRCRARASSTQLAAA